jgi:hypothetical protein
VFGTAETAARAFREATANAAFSVTTRSSDPKFIQSFESWADTLEKNRPFVNLFLAESGIRIYPAGLKTLYAPNGLVVFQTAIAHYSANEVTWVNDLINIDICPP